MKGFPILISILLLAVATSFGQQPQPQQQLPPQQRPQPNGPVGEGPGQAQPPPGGPLGPKAAAPQQNVVAVPVPIAPPQPNGPVQKSLVRITATEVAPDYRAPWNVGMLGRGIGAGFVIDINRIMTNAHVFSNSRYLTEELDGLPNKY